MDARATAVLELPGSADWPAEGFGSVWFLAPDQETPALLRVDPETLEVSATIALPDRDCQGYVVADDAIWACTADGVVRIDPATNEIVDTVPFPIAHFGGRLAVGAGAVWALGTDDLANNLVVRIDPASATATSFPLGHDGFNLAFGFDAVWVTVPQEGLLLRVDPVSGAVTEHEAGLRRPFVVQTGAGSVWVGLGTEGDERVAPGEATVVRVDPSGDEDPISIATGAAPGLSGGMWVSDDAVWIRAPDLFLVRIDHATNAVVDAITGPPDPGDVTEAFGSVWATAEHTLRVYRLEK
ncbi:MAG: hypothetical protein M3295_05460 [Chloroflexota bacterium]|nr:hypothetical protein [Chloroflexota bacterium]